MSDRPAHLIIVTHPGQAGLELFSAHYTEGAAQTTLARLDRLLAPTGSKAHLVTVPEVEGVIDGADLPPLVPAPVPQVAAAHVPTASAAPLAKKPAKPEKFRRLGDPIPADDGAFS